MSDSVWPHRPQPTRLPRLWDSPGKNTGVGCHFLLQCMKVKSESEVAQSSPTLSDPMDRSPPGSSIHGIFQARVLEQGARAFSKKHATLSQIRNKELFIHCAVLSRSVMSNSFYPMDCNPPGSSVPGDSPGKNTGVGCHALLQGIFRTQVSHIAGRFFTVWATREAHSLETLKNNSLSEVHFPPK